MGYSIMSRMMILCDKNSVFLVQTDCSIFVKESEIDRFKGFY